MTSISAEASEDHPAQTPHSGASSAAQRLLGTAKEERYIRQGQVLLERILELPWWWQQSSSVQDLEDRTALSWLASAVLYYWLTHQRHNKNQMSRGVLAGCAIGSCFAVYECWRRQRDEAGQEHDGDNTVHWRRRIFEQQRREMIQRATTTSNELHRDVAPASSVSRNNRKNQMQWFLERFRCTGVWKSLKSIILALQSCASGAGPHDLPAGAASTWTLGIWVLRLRTAYYCLSRSSGGTNDKPMIHTPAPQARSVRLLGLLILSHAAGTGLQHISRLLLQWLARRRLQQQQQQLWQQQPAYDDDSALAETRHTTHHIAESKVCALCQEQPRQVPSCSIRCGHVSCWNCLQRWVETAECCPICRVPCQAQDILPLEQYG